MAIRPIIADRFSPSPAIRTNLIPDRLEAIKPSPAVTAPKPVPAPARPAAPAAIKQTGATAGEANRFANISRPAPAPARTPAPAPAPIGTTPTGAVVTTPGTITPPRQGWSWDEERGGFTPPPADEGTRAVGGTVTFPDGSVMERQTPQTPEEQKVDAAAMLAALINQLLEGDFIGFRGQQAAELRRLQNLRNQLYGDVEMGSTGAVQRQQQLDANARRRLAAGRAVSGMLAGGAYAGTERGLGTIQRAEQDFALQELQRPFREQTASDRLAEFGLSFTPQGRQFNLSDFGSPQDILGGWTRATFGGREAAARARQAAIQQLAQRGIQI